MMREFEIERQFDVKIEDIKPSRGVYFLRTDKGMKCLKKINYGTQKLLFVYGAKEHLIKNGFPQVDKYSINIEGNPYAIINEDIYTLSEWIKGRECDFKNKEDIVNSAKCLAKMHIASKGYEPPENSKLKTDLGRWHHLMEKRVKALDKMRDMGRKKNNKGNFDLNYMKVVKFYKDLGKKAIEALRDSKYDELCSITEREKGFCHHDFTYHNIVVDEEETFNVIDFDYCKRELRSYDISSFMMKVLKRSNWNVENARLIIDSYNEVSPIKEEEYKVIYAFLLFPQRFWRLANRYYYNEVNWPTNTFNKKLEELIGEQEKYIDFIEKFKEIYNEKNI